MLVGGSLPGVWDLLMVFCCGDLGLVAGRHGECY